MKDKKIIKNILIALGVAIALLVLYSMFAPQKSQPTGGLTSKSGTPTQGQISETDTSLVNAKILKILGSIKDIHLDDGIFANPVFRTLVDKNFHVPKPSSYGRANPFLPIGFDKFVERQNQQNTIVSNFVDSQNNVENFFNEANQDQNKDSTVVNNFTNTQ